MDKVVLLALLALIHFTNCQGVAYNYTDDCIKITTEILVKIDYPQTNGSRGVVDVYGKDFSSENPLIFCEKDSSAELNIVWMKDLYSLTLYFTRNSKTWEVSNIQFQYNATDNSDFTNPAIDGDTVETDDTEITKIDLGNSYRCESGNSYTLTSNNSKVYLTLANLQLQAFKFINHAEFGKAQDCHSNPPNHSNQSVVIEDIFEHCIHVNITVEDISIAYQSKNSNNMTAIKPVIKDYDVLNNSHCDDGGNSRSAEIIISWPKPNFYYNLSISFSANYKRGKQGWEIGDMTFQYNATGNPDFKVAPDNETADLSYSTDFTDDTISLTRSYKCDKNENYTFTSNSSTSVTLSVSFIQLQAFQFANPKKLSFGSAVECDQGATPVIVPILVGSALGLFVIILLLAYVIGRLRQRRAKSGYHRL